MVLNVVLWWQKSQKSDLQLLLPQLTRFFWNNEVSHAYGNYTMENHWQLLRKLILLPSVEKCTKSINSAGCKCLRNHKILLSLGQNLKSSLRFYSVSGSLLIEWVLCVLAQNSSGSNAINFLFWFCFFWRKMILQRSKCYPSLKLCFYGTKSHSI